MEKLIYFNPTRDQILIQGAQNYQGTDALHIFAHGSPHSITIYRNNTKTDYTNSKINGFIEQIIQPSASWQNLQPGQKLTIILHSCRTAAGPHSFAQNLSRALGPDITVIAPDERLYLSRQGQVGTFRPKHLDQNGEFKSTDHTRSKTKGHWFQFRNGNTIARYDGLWQSYETSPLRYHLHRLLTLLRH